MLNQYNKKATSVINDRYIVCTVEKRLANIRDISNDLQRAGVVVSQSSIHRKHYEQKYRGFARSSKAVIRMWYREKPQEVL